MKKLFAVIAAVVFFAGTGFAEGNGNIVVKAGLDTLGDIRIESEGVSGSLDMDLGFSLSAEYLYPVHEIIKVGGGLEYLFKRGFDREETEEEFGKLSYLPVYATVKVNPITPAPEVFFKGNLGYNVLFDSNEVPEEVKRKGGLYFALGAGYEFDFGLVLEAMYGVYYSKFSYGGQSIDLRYSKLGINVGYKIAL